MNEVLARGPKPLLVMVARSGSVEEVIVRRSHLMCLVLLLSSASGLAAQQPAEPLWGRLSPGELVRVRPRNSDRIAARVLAVGADSLVISTQPVRALRPGTIDSLWVRGHATVLGAIIGAVGGAATSLAASSVVCQAIREGFLCGESPTAIAWSTAGGAALGAAVGYVVRPWRLRYARDRTIAARLTVPRPLGLGLSVTLP